MLSILSGILNMGMRLSLRYDSRPEVEDFFRVLHSGSMPQNRKETSISHFFEAIDLAWSTQLDVEKTEPITLKTESVRVKMADYIKHHVCVVREIMPSDTDVAGYFEIMNNRNNNTLAQIPPKVRISGFVGYLKGKSCLMIYEKHKSLQFKYRSREFWCRAVELAVIDSANSRFL